MPKCRTTWRNRCRRRSWYGRYSRDGRRYLNLDRRGIGTRGHEKGANKRKQGAWSAERPRRPEAPNVETTREDSAADVHSQVLATAVPTTATCMLVLGSVPCESFCTEFRKPNEWPTSALHHDQHRTGFPSIGEASGLCAYVPDTWPTVFTPEVIAARAKVPGSNSEGIGLTYRATTCGFSIAARSFDTTA